MSYQAPQTDIEHILTHIIELDGLIDDGLLGELDKTLISAILEEAGKFAAEEIAPLNKTGDREGCQLENGNVTTPNGWQTLYSKWQEAGWATLSAPSSHGGQALPHIIAQVVGEYWNSANMAFGLCPLLTQGAVDAIAQHGDEPLKALFLEKMINGEWTGTMNLTEPQAGSDLAAIRTKATPQENGTYQITGTKIFITYGEHDLTENIIHLVLARLPDAPEGTRGISLFLVPKINVDDQGNLKEKNNLVCSGLEHKLGIHASPTCVMNFEEAKGYLVGEENRGLHAMFTMMNLARLSVGTQGVAIMERSHQQALAYAKERLQGKALNSSNAKMDPIIKHPDIRATLAAMQATIQACRAICLLTAKQIDLEQRAPSKEARKDAAHMAALLTPIAKAFSTDCSLDITSSGLQVNGGMGFIEETGSAQHYRDARILPIYEGTNGIQAIDLMMRKIPQDGGKTIKTLIQELEEIHQNLDQTPDLKEQTGEELAAALNELKTTLTYLQTQQPNDPTSLLYAATPFLKCLGLTLGAALLIKGAISASQAASPDHERQTALAALFTHQLLPQTSGLRRQICGAAHKSEALTAHIFNDGM